MSIEGQGHFFTIYFPGFVCFVLYLAKISGERLQDHWSSGLYVYYQIFCAEWSPDGRYLATVCRDGKLRIFDPRQSLQPIKVKYWLYQHICVYKMKK